MAYDPNTMSLDEIIAQALKASGAPESLAGDAAQREGIQPIAATPPTQIPFDQNFLQGINAGLDKFSKNLSNIFGLDYNQAPQRAVPDVVNEPLPQGYDRGVVGNLAYGAGEYAPLIAGTALSGGAEAAPFLARQAVNLATDVAYNLQIGQPLDENWALGFALGSGVGEFLHAAPEIPGYAKALKEKIFRDNGVNPANIDTTQIINTTNPQAMLPHIGEVVADGNLQKLDAMGQSVRLKNVPVDEIARNEGNDVLAEVMTADGPISSKLAIQDKLDKMFLAQGIQQSSILDEVRPTASLGERRYILLNGDEEAFRWVSDRFKTPSKTIDKLIEKSKTLPEDQKGQFLFKSIQEQAHIARLRGDVDTYQVAKDNPAYENVRIGKLKIDEANAMDIPIDEAIFQRQRVTAYPTTDEVFYKSQYVPSLKLMAMNREMTFAGISDAIKRGDTSFADELLDAHVKLTQLRSTADKVQKDLSDLSLQSNSQFLKGFNWQEIDIGTYLEGPVPGVAMHFPEFGGYPSTVITQYSHLEKMDALEQILRHEYAHALDDYINRRVAKGNLEAIDLAHALRRAATFHDARAWDPIAEAVSVVKGRPRWPEIQQRTGKPDVYGAKHDEMPDEIVADLLALMTTPVGRESINPQVREILEPIFGKIKEPYAPKYVVPEWKRLTYSGYPGSRFKQVGQYPKHNTVRDAGKVFTSNADEGHIRFAAMSAASDPNTGGINPSTQEVIKNAGPSANQGLTDLLEGAGPFRKGPMLEHMDELQKPVTLRDFFEAFKTIRASGMLTGPATHGANATSNVFKVLEAPGITAAGAAADAAKVALGLQKERQVFLGEALAQMQGQWATIFGMENALPANLRQFAQQIRRSKDYVGDASVLSKLAAAIPNKALSRAAGYVAKGIELPFEALRAADTFFFDANFAGAVYRQAYLKSMKEGKTFAEAMGELTKKINGFDDEAKALREAAAQQGRLQYLSKPAKSTKEFVGVGKLTKDQASQLPNNRTGSLINNLEKLTATERYGKTSGEQFIHDPGTGQISEQLNMFGQREGGIQEQPSLFGDNPHAVDLLGENQQEISKYAHQYMLQNVPADIAEAKLTAERSIFVAREGKMLDQALDLLDRADRATYGAVSGALPFRRTPAYIVREGLRSSPVGFLPILSDVLQKPADVGTREMSLRIGQAMFGTMLFYALWRHIDNGNIKGDPTGYNPNKAQRDTYYAAGRKPGSLHINMFGKTYTFPMDRIQPIGSAIATMIGYKQQLDEAKKHGLQENVFDQGAQFAWELTKNLGIGDFSRNMGDLLEAINSGPEIGKTNAAKRYLNQLGATVIPAAIRQEVRIGGLEKYGLEGRLNPKDSGLLTAPYEGAKAALGIEGDRRVGLFGNTTEPKVNDAAALASIGEVSEDPVINKMIEVGAFHQSPTVPDVLAKRPKKEQVAFQIGKGRLQKQFVERVVLNPGFAGLAPDAQKRLIDKAFVSASQLADKRAKAAIKLKGVINENVIFRGRI